MNEQIINNVVDKYMRLNPYYTNLVLDDLRAMNEWHTKQNIIKFAFNEVWKEENNRCPVCDNNLYCEKCDRYVGE